jgi:hypothetical protein
VNLRSARVVLRPRSLADVLDLAVPFARGGARPLGALAVLVMSPIAGLAAWARLRAGWGWPAVWLLVLEAAFLADGVFTVALGDLLFREPREVAPGAAARRFLGQLPKLLVSVVGRQVVVAASAILVVVPFLQAPATQFAPEALLLEGATPFKAWARSRALARNRMGFCFGLWAAALLLPVIGAIVGDQLGNAIVGFVLQLGRPTGDLFGGGGSGFAVLGALLAVPVGATARFLGYVDLRTRKEGWDIQLRFMSLVADVATGRRRAA